MHPTRDDLHGFVLGTLEDSAAEGVAEHVEQCQDCELTMRALEGTNDTLISSLQQPGDADPHSAESECRHMLDVIQAIGQEPSVAAPPNRKPEQANRARQADSSLGEIGPYRILAKLGEGGMGAVYKALHTKLEKVVALKVLPPGKMKDAAAVARFEREMKAVGRLEHPNIVAAHDAGEVAGTHYLVMQYVEGEDLSALARRVGPLPIVEACELVRQAAIGLQEAHEHGMVHRDIKPSNLILSQSRKSEVGTRNKKAKSSSGSSDFRVPNSALVKILDLGLALLADKESPDQKELTGTGQMMGTIDYMAPEQGLDTHHVDIRADIYSLGATLYKLLTGEAPFGGPQFDTPVKKLMTLATQDAPPIRDKRPDVPNELAAVIARMLHREADKRYATPEEVAEALAPFAAEADLTKLLSSVGATGGLPGSVQGASARADKQPVAPNSEAPTADHLSNGLSETAPSVADSLRESEMRLAERFAHTPRVPASPRPSLRVWWRDPRNKILTATAALTLFLLLTAVTLYFRTKDGVIVVEIDDPEGLIEVTIVGDDLKITDKSKKGEPLHVSPGEKKLRVKRGDLVFFADAFELERGEETVVRLTYFAGQVVATRDGEPLGGSPPPLPSEYALEFDGETAYVEMPTLRVDASEPLTVELLVKLHPQNFGTFASAYSPTSALGLVRSWKNGNERDVPYFYVRRDLEFNKAGTSGKFTTGEWLHLAGVWDGTESRLYINGLRHPVTSQTRNVRPEHTVDLNQPFMLGGESASGRFAPSKLLKGVIEEVRLSKAARYDKDFTPPASGERFSADENTLALYHFDEGRGDELKDSSGNEHHGKIVGAKWVKADGSASPAEGVGPYALQFNGNSTVNLGELPLDLTRPFTIEAYATPAAAEEDGYIGAFFNQLSLRMTSGHWSFGGRMSRVSAAEPIALGQRVHLAAVYTGSEICLFVDGRSAGRKVATDGLGVVQPEGNFVLGYKLAGTIDELHISQTARYEQDFAPPPQVEADEHTLALYHFDEGSGDELKDSSGSNHHGKIAGAKWVKADGSTEAVPPPADDYALEFDGASSFVQIDGLTHDKAFEPFTLELWAKPAPQGTPEQVLMRMDGESIVQLKLSQNKTWQSNHYFAKAKEGGSRFDYNVYLAGDRVDSADGQYHCAIVFDKTADGFESRFYVSGLLVGRKAITPPFYPHPSTANFSRLAATWGDEGARRGNYFAGQLDEVRISSVARYKEEFTPPRLGERFAPDEHTVALYHFDEGSGDDLKDSSGNNHHGKIVGAKWVKVEAETEAAPPPAEYALEFDGESSTVSLPNLPYAGLDDLTVEAWLTPHDVKRGRKALVMGQCLLGTIPRNDQVFWEFKIGRFAKPDKSEIDWFLSQISRPVELGKRVHIAGVRRGGRMQVYINGTLGTPMISLRPGLTALADFPLLNAGRAVLSDRTHWQGLIDELRISNSARYDKEFTPDRRFEPDADTLALYHFDEGQGDELIDSSGNGYHGVIKGAKWVRSGDGPPGSDAISPSEFVPLFNGTDLTGWKIDPRFPGEWRVENGILSGFAEKSTYLLSERGDYADVHLRAEVRVSARTSAGVYCRASATDAFESQQWGWTAPHGYLAKVNVSDADRKSGSLYVISATGQTGTSVDAAIKPGEWVTLETIAQGNRIQVFVDGQLMTDFVDEKKVLALGHIAMQFHGGTQPVEFRNVEVLELSPVQSRFALDFNHTAGEGSARVEVPGEFPVAKPCTIEMYVTPRSGGSPKNRMLFSATGQLILKQYGDAWDWSSPREVGSRENQIRVPGSVQPHRRTHLACVSTGSELWLYIDGRLAGKCPAKVDRPTVAVCQIGGMPRLDESWEPFDGVIDELRISTVARYDEDFTPEAEFSKDVDTFALYRFDDGQGEVLTDSSGHSRHGKIIGAKWVRAADSMPRFGLDFNRMAGEGTARVEVIGDLPVAQPCTVEMYVTSRSCDSPKSRMTFNAAGQLILKQVGDAWDWSGLRAPGSSENQIKVPKSVQTERRVHVACVSTGSELRLYFDGRLAARHPVKYSVNNAQFYEIGGMALTDVAWWEPFDGVIDELRISTVARYEEDFTPEAEFSKDDDTFALYHFDEGQGDVLTDSSGNNYHGKIVGAKWVKVDEEGFWPLQPEASAEIQSPTGPPSKQAAIEDFREIHGVDISALEGWVDGLPKGFVPVRLAHLPGVNGPRFSAVAVLGSKPVDFQFLPRVTEQEIGPNYERLAGRNQFMAMCGYVDAGNCYEAQVWQPATTGWGHWGGPLESILRKIEECQGTDLRPIHLYLGVARTEGDVAGTVELGPTNGSSWRAESGLTLVQLRQLIADSRSDGWRPDVFCSYEDGGPRFAVVLVQDAEKPEWGFDSELSSQEYAAALSAFAQRGFYPRAVAPYGEADNPRYAVAWLRYKDSSVVSQGATVESSAALVFDGQSRVRLPVVKVDGGAVTLEAIATPTVEASEPSLLVGLHGSLALGLHNWDSRWNFGVTEKDRLVELAEQAVPSAVPGRRTHVAGVVRGAQALLFVDGKLVSSKQLAAPPGEISAELVIGDKFRGLIHEVRVSTSALYEADFTPPARLEKEADTLALYRFDSGTGGEAKDLSGNSHHGTIEGAKWMAADGSASPPVVIIARDGRAQQSLAGLSEAVAAAQPGDTIEIRGDGPFVTPAIDLGDKPLTIRAAAGYWPVIELDPEGVEADLPLLTTQAALTLEGLEFRRMGGGKPGAVGLNHIQSQRAPLALANCRFVRRSTSNAMIAAVRAQHSPFLQARNCVFLGNWHYGLWHDIVPESRSIVANCLFLGGSRAMNFASHPVVHPATLQLLDNTILTAAEAVTLWVSLAEVPKKLDEPPPVRIEVRRNIFGSGIVSFFYPAASKELEDFFDRDHRLVGQSLFAMEDHDNRVRPGAPLVGYIILGQDNQHRLKAAIGTIEQWTEFWKLNKSDLIFEKVRFHKDLAHNTPAPEELTPQDFRLQGDDPGNKNLGADVDLVGPGPAYERWKQTPEYEQWPKDTAQSPPSEASATKLHYGLLFDKVGDRGLAELPYHKESVLTIEARVKLFQGKGSQIIALRGGPNHFVLVRDSDSFGWITNKLDLSQAAYFPHGGTGRWVHVVGVWNGREWSAFVDGVAVVARRSEGAAPFNQGSTSSLQLGNPSSTRIMTNSVIGEVRISRGARYTADFSPAPRLFADEDTLALYQFSEGQGDRLTDSSGNGYHGTISGARWVRIDGADNSPPPAEGIRAGQQWTGNGLEMPFCWCPPGKFTMGSPEGEAGREPNEGQAEVTLTRGFWLGKHEVTQRQYSQLMGGNPSHFSANGRRKDDVIGIDTSDFPVEGVSWAAATEYCARLTDQERALGRLPRGWEYRLPTEAQWEYACRAGATTAFPGGDAETEADAHAWHAGNSEQRTHAVGQKQANAWGLHDMHGNVWEACRDCSAKQAGGGIDPENPAVPNSGRAARGGAWFAETQQCRSAYRLASAPTWANADTGFRVALVRIDPPTGLEPNSALSFAKGQQVLVESLTYDGQEKFTLEAFVTPSDTKSVQRFVSLLTEDGALSLAASDTQWLFDVPCQGEVNQTPTPRDATQQRVHLAGVIDKDVFRLFVNGRYAAKGIRASAVKPLHGGLRLGGDFAGVLDEVRISKAARYWTDFAPPKPTDRFESDADTLALYHCDEADGDVLVDSSGNGHHGTITGAKWVTTGTNAE